MSFSRLKNLSMILFLFVCVSASAACGNRSASPENVYIADEADNGQTVTMRIGDALQVSLHENSDGGYEWGIVTNDGAVLQPTDGPAYDSGGETAGGAGQVKSFTFRAAGLGTSVLRLVNARTQETAVEPAATFELTVQVVD